MKVDIPTEFWKKYIESDTIERDKLLKIPVNSIYGLIDSKLPIKLKKHCIKIGLKGYFDDLINTMIIERRLK